jgi:ribonuclease HII
MKKKLPDFKFEKELWEKGYKIVVGVDEVGRGAWAGPVVAGAVVFGKKLSSRAKRGVPRGLNKADGILNQVQDDVRALGIDDSKRLTAKRRGELAMIIKKEALAYGLGEVDVATINRVGIIRATQTAFRRAVADVREKLSAKHKEPRSKETPNSRSQGGYEDEIDFLLADAFYVPYLKGLPVGRKRAYGRWRHPEFISGSHRRESGDKEMLKQDQHDEGGEILNQVQDDGWVKDGSRQKAIVHGDRRSITIAAASIIAKVYRDKMMVGLSKRYRGHGFEKHKGYGTKKHRWAILKYGITRFHRKKYVESGMRGIAYCRWHMA